MATEDAAELRHRLPTRKWRFTRPGKSHWVLLLEAVAAALAAHALLLLIDYRELRPSPTPATEPGVTIVSELSLGEMAEEFNLWLTVNDPARFASVSSPGGYLSLLPVAERPLPRRHGEFFTPMLPEPATAKFLPVEIDAADFVLPPLPAVPPPPPRQRVINGSGETMELPGLALDPGAGAAAPTHLEFRRNGRLCRVSLIASCGNRELDLLAEKALYREAAKLPEQDSYLFFWTTGETAVKEKAK